jgi:glutamate synthase (NADPH/NADH) small chain
MGDPIGFLEMDRQGPRYRPVSERVRDYRAVERTSSHEEILRQAARCMDCGTPFCHAYGCPLGNIAPEFNDAVYHGNWKGALDILLSTNNFPEFTGRICPAPCEAACVAGIHLGAVTIRQIELTIVERGFENGYIRPAPPVRRRDECIAVIGSGPAGLAAADSLNKAGYRVTVFEAAARAGGILRYGIPDFKLEKWVVDRRIELMAEEGVQFETGVDIGSDISYRYLRNRFQAVCLAGGARRPRDLKAPGRELQGIEFAMDYLSAQNRRLAGEILPPARDISAAGKRVAVIGGGDTGSDCVGTALRQGAERVHQLEILPKPPADRSPETPWPQWPLMLRKTHAHEEGGEQLWSVTTERFLGVQGILKGMQCVAVEWRQDPESGRATPEPKPGTRFELPVDLVLLAMGFTGPAPNPMLAELGIAEQGPGGGLATDAHCMTRIPGLFVAGDMRQGQSLVVRAIADGRRAAAGIRRYLEEGPPSA